MFDYDDFYKILREIEADINNKEFISEKTKELRSEDPYIPKIKHFEIDRRKKIHCIRNNC